MIVELLKCERTRCACYSTFHTLLDSAGLILWIPYILVLYRMELKYITMPPYSLHKLLV